MNRREGSWPRASAEVKVKGKEGKRRDKERTREGWVGRVAYIPSEGESRGREGNGAAWAATLRPEIEDAQHSIWPGSGRGRYQWWRWAVMLFPRRHICWCCTCTVDVPYSCEISPHRITHSAFRRGEQYLLSCLYLPIRNYSQRSKARRMFPSVRIVSLSHAANINAAR